MDSFARTLLVTMFVAMACRPVDGHAAEATSQVWPPVVTKDFAKAKLLEMALLINQAPPEIRNDQRSIQIQQMVTRCFVTPMNAALDGVFPVGVAELNRDEFIQRWSNILIANRRNIDNCVESYRVGTSQSSSEQLMDLDDLRADIASLDGRRVRVRAVGYYVANLLMIKKGPLDTSPIMVDIASVSREQRRSVIQRCSDISAGCQLTVTGKVEKKSFQTGITAESLEW